MSALQVFINYWHWDIPGIVIAAGLTAFHFYANGFRLTHKSYLFLNGIILLLIATCSPLDYLSHYYLFSAHMAQHITLLLIIPPVLLSGSEGEYFQRLFEKPGFRSSADILLRPVPAWLLGVGVMWIWHVPELHNSMIHSPVMHFLNLITLLAAGLIFIWPVFAPVEFRKLQSLQSAFYLFTACVGCTVLGIMITFAPAGLYSNYMAGSDIGLANTIRTRWGITGAVDQQAGGLIMWVPACFIYIVNIMIILLKWYQAPETGKSLN